MAKSTRVFNGKQYRLKYSTPDAHHRRQAQDKARQYAKGGYLVVTIRDAKGLDHIYIRKAKRTGWP